MKNLSDKVNEQRKKAMRLREVAWDCPIEKAIEIRKTQQKEWDKYEFFRGLEKALERVDSKEEEVFKKERELPVENIGRFKARIKKKYGYTPEFELYRRIVNYQVSKYGRVLEVLDSPYTLEEHSKQRVVRNMRHYRKMKGRKSDEK